MVSPNLCRTRLSLPLQTCVHSAPPQFSDSLRGFQFSSALFLKSCSSPPNPTAVVLPLHSSTPTHPPGLSGDPPPPSTRLLLPICQIFKLLYPLEFMPPLYLRTSLPTLESCLTTHFIILDRRTDGLIDR